MIPRRSLKYVYVTSVLRAGKEGGSTSRTISPHLHPWNSISCVMNLCAPPLVEMLLKCPPCLQTASYAAASSI